MTKAPLFAHTGKGFRWLALLFLMLMGALVGMLLGYALMGIMAISDAESLAGLRVMQLSTQLGLFFLAPAAWFYFFEDRHLKTPWLPDASGLLLTAAGVLLMLAALPLVHGLAEWNQSLRLPERMAGFEQLLRDMEDRAEALTKKFLEVSNVGGLLFNLLMIALIPAVGEELLFRGVIQNELIRSLKSKHLAIVSGAMLFSLLHFQFYGLLPRFLLGLFLGYFYFWSASLWVPILMHLLNNSLAVIAFYLHFNGFSDVPMDDFGAVTAWWQWAASALLSAVLVAIAYSKRKC